MEIWGQKCHFLVLFWCVLVFGGFARYFQRVLPDFEPFPPDFLQDFTQLPSKSLSLILGEGNLGGGRKIWG